LLAGRREDPVQLIHQAAPVERADGRHVWLAGHGAAGTIARHLSRSGFAGRMIVTSGAPAQQFAAHDGTGKTWIYGLCFGSGDRPHRRSTEQGALLAETAD
jgi:hypothetical protein